MTKREKERIEVFTAVSAYINNLYDVAYEERLTPADYERECREYIQYHLDAGWIDAEDARDLNGQLDADLECLTTTLKHRWNGVDIDTIERPGKYIVWRNGEEMIFDTEIEAIKYIDDHLDTWEW